jgi:hypothetical protein
MSNSLQDKGVAAPEESRIFRAAVGFAVVLCIACCALILLIPTASTSVDTVYQGF